MARRPVPPLGSDSFVRACLRTHCTHHGPRGPANIRGNAMTARYLVIAVAVAGAMAAIAQGCSGKLGSETTGTLKQAVGPVSSSEVPLDPTTVPKFVNQLNIPDVWAPRPIVKDGKVVRNEYTLAVVQSQAQMLPPGFPTTTVMAYAGDVRTATGTRDVRVTPGAVFENMRGVPSRLHWQDHIDQPAFLQVDP